MESGASENKQTVCKDVNKKARKGNALRGRAVWSTVGTGACTADAPEVKYTAH